MGYVTVVLSTSANKESYAKKLGADYFINAKTDNVADKLKKLGGAKLVVLTAPSTSAIEQIYPGMTFDVSLSL